MFNKNTPHLILCCIVSTASTFHSFMVSQDAHFSLLDSQDHKMFQWPVSHSRPLPVSRLLLSFSCEPVLNYVLPHSKLFIHSPHQHAAWPSNPKRTKTARTLCDSWDIFTFYYKTCIKQIQCSDFTLLLYMLLKLTNFCLIPVTY